MLDAEPGRTHTVATALERIAAKARREPKLTFTSFAHHLTLDRLRDHLSHMDKTSAAGVDGYTVAEVTANLDWVAKEVLRQIHTQGYHPPPVRRVWIPKPGKAEKRPIGIPTVFDRALQKSTAQVLEAIYEQDFLNGSFGGRPGRSAHHALATLNEIIAGQEGQLCAGGRPAQFLRKSGPYVGDAVHATAGWGSPDADAHAPVAHSRSHDAGWRGGGTESVVHPKGAVSVCSSAMCPCMMCWMYGCEKKRRKQLEGEAYWVRYLDDFVLCFPYRSDALRVQKLLEERLKSMRAGTGTRKDALDRVWALCPTEMPPSKGGDGQRPAASWASRTTAHAIGKATSRCERRTERKRLQRAAQTIQRLIRDRLHAPVPQQQHALNQYLRGHYNYDGIAGNIQSLLRISRRTEKLWRKTLSRRSQDGEVHWEKFQKLKRAFPWYGLNCPSPMWTFRRMPSCEPGSEERSAGNPHATICGGGCWVTTPSTRRLVE